MVLTGDATVRPFRLSHDDQATFGFRIERSRSLFTAAWSMSYAADLGTWDATTAEALCDADLVALEFNHDPDMQRSSGRPWSLVRRVLGDEGHLSNAQAASLLGEAARASRPGRLRNVVQLHLSRECNRPSLAAAAARKMLEECGWSARLHTASQHEPLCISEDA
jgi:phosphoribosyl 1,2-cyclic phosphodiesterase